MGEGVLFRFMTRTYCLSCLQHSLFQQLGVRELVAYFTWSDPSTDKHFKHAVLLPPCLTDVSVCASRLIRKRRGIPPKSFLKIIPSRDKVSVLRKLQAKHCAGNPQTTSPVCLMLASHTQLFQSKASIPLPIEENMSMKRQGSTMRERILLCVKNPN